MDYVGKNAGYSQKKRDEYTNIDYHAPADHIKPDWDLTGAADDAQLMLVLGYRVANADRTIRQSTTLSDPHVSWREAVRAGKRELA